MSLAPPVDWLLVDGLRFRSVRACADALREWEPLPGELTIVGDWYAPFADAAWRAEIRVEWPAIGVRNRATSRY
jgi:hypothetical protein